jgi:hypothetical protein
MNLNWLCVTTDLEPYTMGLLGDSENKVARSGQSHFRIVPVAGQGNGHPSLRA